MSKILLKNKTVHFPATVAQKVKKKNQNKRKRNKKTHLWTNNERKKK